MLVPFMVSVDHERNGCYKASMSVGSKFRKGRSLGRAAIRSAKAQAESLQQL